MEMFTFFRTKLGKQFHSNIYNIVSMEVVFYLRESQHFLVTAFDFA
jgi:hypothetical protein